MTGRALEIEERIKAITYRITKVGATEYKELHAERLVLRRELRILLEGGA